LDYFTPLPTRAVVPRHVIKIPTKAAKHLGTFLCGLFKTLIGLCINEENITEYVR